MDMDNLVVLQEILKVCVHDREEEKEKLQNNLNKISEIDLFMKSIKEEADLKFFSPRSPENIFGDKIEGELATLLRVLLGTIIIDPQRRDCSSLQLEKEQLSAQFALLITRTEAFRDYYKDIYQQIKDGFPYADIPQYSKTDFQRIHTSEILNFGMSNFYANLFSDWHWAFIINHTELPFITSDNPVIRIDHSKKTNKPISVASPEVTYFVPLSPTVAVEIFHKDILKNDLVFFDIYQIKNIASYNKEIIKNCSRFLFSNKSFEALKCARDKINDET